MKSLLKSDEFNFVLDYLRKFDWQDKYAYGNWLAQTYYFVSHSVRLSALGTSRLPVDSAVGKRMLAHTVEEKGHHLVAQKDIEALGFSLGDFPCFGVTNAFYQAQYYKVLFEHPNHLLGQIFMLESVAAELGPWLYEQVKPAHGDAASRFIKLHAHEDQDHVQKALEAINAFPEENRRGTAENFYQACELYYLILRTIKEAAVREMPSSAAA